MNKHKASNNITLDNKHNELINYFKNNKEKIIPKLNQEIDKINNSIEKINKKNNNKNNNKNKNNNNEEIDNYNQRIKILTNKIKKLQKEETDYYLNNSKYIFEYFEDKKNIDNISNSNIEETKSTNNKINSFFNISTNKPLNDNNDDIIKKNNSNDSNINNNIDKYFYNINKLPNNINNYCYDSNICNFCNNGEMIYVESEGILICNNCSKTTKYLIENEKPSYKEPPKEVCFYAYKRINHLREILAQFQAKESTHIPEEVLENFKNQIKKERLTLENLTNKKAKEILKNLGYNKYYEHIPFIKDKLGIKPPVMTSELEETLCNLFIEIQKPYSIYCPKERVNFLNYYYTLYKLCELLKETKFLPYFPMLKDREKRIEQDQIWKKICEELGWKFIPTI
tara:strand:- start:408 stop:1601 length:1194 start_codon:yes stop_codon:yes gene_type:complete